ncbi:MAG: TldD/PmbA family protein [candidate division Zixibacteria bacterium]|nr:TldD/PmbA family protein [candidate division Zixibacteria bacterium]
MDIQKIAMDGLVAASMHKASYCDIRYEIITDEKLSYSDGDPDPIESSLSAGWAVRLLINGAWGFASTDDPAITIDKLTVRAAAIAKASAKVSQRPIELTPSPVESGEFISRYKKDPFTVPLTEKIAFLTGIDEAMASHADINSRSCFVSFRKLEKFFYSSEGSEQHQVLIQSGSGISMGISKSRRENYERSYPKAAGQYELKGYELLDELDFKKHIPQLADEIKQLTTATACPQKNATLVLAGNITSLVIHESIGHALELDRVFGMERNFSGISFATPDNLNHLQYGADIVNVSVDASADGALGSFGWDDEGVKSKKIPLIKNGILTDYLSSRDTAGRVNHVSTGNLRAEGWKNIPIVRMSNTILEPGDKSFADIIGEVEDGIYMDGPTSWSIDDLRKNFQFGCEIGWEIKNGKLADAVKNPTFSGCTTQFWNNCDAIGDKSQFVIQGTPNCGKGQPGQNARTGEGASTTRFLNIEVGVQS